MNPPILWLFFKSLDFSDFLMEIIYTFSSLGWVFPSQPSNLWSNHTKEWLEELAKFGYWSKKKIEKNIIL
jgi:hypothetical protein